MQEIIDQWWPIYGSEIEAKEADFTARIDTLRARGARLYPDIRIAADGKVAGAVNIADYKILYLLVRVYKPKVIFEIGTWIGTSAMIMAEAMRANGTGGKIYTCDHNHYYALDDSYSDIIVPINAFSAEALDQIPEDTKIDFVFADGELTFRTISKLKPLLTTEAIIATHDYTPPDDKGVLNVVRMQLSSMFTYHIFLPQSTSQSSIAVLSRKTISTSKSFLYRFLFTARRAAIAFVTRLYKKITGYYS